MHDKFNMNESPGYLVARVNWHMKTNFQKLIRQRSLQVTPEQWAVLRFVFESPDISQAEIARRSVKDKTNITRILDVLAKYGYIRRQNDEHDRHGYNIFLTGEGEAVLQQLIPLAKQSNEDFAPTASMMMVNAKVLVCFIAGALYIMTAAAILRKAYRWTLAGVIAFLLFDGLYLVELALWWRTNPNTWQGV